MSGALLRGSETAPDLVGPVNAWRVWRVVRDDGRLVLNSIVRRTLWRPRQALVAECLGARPVRDWLCRRPRHCAPSVGCACGIYGADLGIAAQYLCNPAAGGIGVIGVVSLWGSVIECEHGFRASHAYPRRLYVPADAGRRGRRAADVAAELADYGVDVEVLATGARNAVSVLAQHELV